MSENVQEKKSSKTVIILLIVLILLLLVGGAVTIIFLLNKDGKETANAEETTNPLIQYDGAAVVLNEDDYKTRMEQLYKEAAEGQLTVQYKTTAISSDGTHFQCEIGNSSANHYDMYFNIYLDDTLQDQILLTGLFPPGSGIEEFESEIPLDPGQYKAVLVFTQVKDDHATIHAQSMVYLTLAVGEQ